MNIYRHKEDGKLYVLYATHPKKFPIDGNIQAWEFRPWYPDAPFVWTITPIIRQGVRYGEKMEDYELAYER